MRRFTAIFVCSLGLSALSNLAMAADAEGCADLKTVPRLEGCIIQDCSARKHDSIELSEAAVGPVDATVNSLTYSCPASMDLARVKRELEARIRKAGFQNVAPDKNLLDSNDSANPAGFARKGSEWLRWSAVAEDGTVSYSLTSAGASIEACGQTPVLTSLKQCEVVECASKSEDSVAMRTGESGETSLTGNVQTLTLSCPSAGAPKSLSAVEAEVASSGFEILFHDRDHGDAGGITARSGKRWVGLVSAREGESVSYALTVVPSAEVLTASIPEPNAVAAAPPPEPAPKPSPAQSPVPALRPVVAASLTAPAPKPEPPAPAVQPAPSASIVASASATATTSAAAPGATPHTEFAPPKPILKVPIEATHDLIYSVTGDVAIYMLVDVSEDGTVTKAELTGRITKDVRTLESAALEAVSHWRFEPARQDGRAVAAVKIPVEMHFHGRPWRF